MRWALTDDTEGQGLTEAGDGGVLGLAPLRTHITPGHWVDGQLPLVQGQLQLLTAHHRLLVNVTTGRWHCCLGTGSSG